MSSSSNASLPTDIPVAAVVFAGLIPFALVVIIGGIVLHRRNQKRLRLEDQSLTHSPHDYGLAMAESKAYAQTAVHQVEPSRTAARLSGELPMPYLYSHDVSSHQSLDSMVRRDSVASDLDAYRLAKPCQPHEVEPIRGIPSSALVPRSSGRSTPLPSSHPQTAQSSRSPSLTTGYSDTNSSPFTPRYDRDRASFDTIVSTTSINPSEELQVITRPLFRPQAKGDNEPITLPSTRSETACERSRPQYLHTLPENDHSKPHWPAPLPLSATIASQESKESASSNDSRVSKRNQAIATGLAREASVLSISSQYSEMPIGDSSSQNTAAILNPGQKSTLRMEGYSRSSSNQGSIQIPQHAYALPVKHESRHIFRST